MPLPAHARAIRQLLLLPLILLGSCFEGDPEEVYYVSLEVSDIKDSLTSMQRVNILVTEPGPAGDTLDVLWDDSLPDAGRLRKLRAERYRGGDAVFIIAGYHGAALKLRRQIIYDGAAKTAVILDKGIRDSLAPVLTSRIPDDTLDLDDWNAFPRHLATCTDDRDGVLNPELDTLPRDTKLPTVYLAIVFCRDLSRNNTRLEGGDTVMVRMRLKGGSRPILALAGRDSLDLPLGRAFEEQATCRDEEDGELPVQTVGKVAANTLGRYVLIHSCRDTDGNVASRRQVVWVSEAEDREPPIVLLNGPDSLDHPLGRPYADMGAACTDLRDGPRPLLGSGDVDVDRPGVYRWEYKCRDLTGNTAYPVRKVRVVAYDSVPVRADEVFDTTDRSRFVNSGQTPALGFYQTAPYADDHASFLAFDLGGVRRDSLKSARGVFLTYVGGPYVALDSFPVTFKVYRILSPWVEGTGNWYYNRGFFQNRGHVLLKHYPLREEIKATSTDPIVVSGVTKEAKAMVRIANMQEAGTDSLSVTYRSESFSHGHPGTIPERKHLVRLEIDLTRYVRETPVGEDYGLVILSGGMPQNNRICWVTKELGDGSMAPYLQIFR